MLLDTASRSERRHVLEVISFSFLQVTAAVIVVKQDLDNTFDCYCNGELVPSGISAEEKIYMIGDGLLRSSCGTRYFIVVGVPNLS